MKRQKKYVALSLWPSLGNTTITPNDNRMFINEGRDGKFEDITEIFYNEMVNKYDSRTTK
jgi:hypothetical protein